MSAKPVALHSCLWIVQVNKKEKNMQQHLSEKEHNYFMLFGLLILIILL